VEISSPFFSGLKWGHSHATLTPIAPMVDAIIVNHNSGEALDACLASILPQASSVVVVDNASEPAGFDAIISRYAANPKLRVLRIERNTGFSVGCNLGAAQSSARHLLFLNPDSIASPRMVKTLADFLENNPRAAIAGGFLLGADGAEQSGGRRLEPTPLRAFVRTTGLWRLFRHGDFLLEHRVAGDSPQELDSVSGACLMIRRVAFEAIGGFDEGYFLHCEDLDLCATARKAGWKVFSVPDAPVFHTKGVCSRSKPLFVEWHKHRGMLRYHRKHFCSAFQKFLYPAMVAAVWSRFALLAARTVISGGFKKNSTAPALVSPPLPSPPEAFGVLGASSFVGRHLLELAHKRGLKTAPFTRDLLKAPFPQDWHSLSAEGIFKAGPLHNWIALCPVNALPPLLPLLELAGIRSLVAVSSTSRFTKKNSSDQREKRLAASLESAETRLASLARSKGIRLVLLRTTLIHDGIHDSNIASLARFIRRFHFLPVLKPAHGLRQPLHAADVADACLAAMQHASPLEEYTLSGGETLTYLEMAGRVFDAAAIPRRFADIPQILLNALDVCGSVLPLSHRIPVAMFHRMNADLAFDHSHAERDLGFRPRAFRPILDFNV